ncbi:MAG TPA: YidB family protein [Bacteroidota bacterium]|nr:YidB family protein [Bacteroidota bacterium]
MGILDSLASLAGGTSDKSNLLNAVMGVVANQQGGGLAGLVQQFEGSGLGNIVNSWVGTGQNLPISAQQIQQALGSDTIKQLAAKAGIDPQQVTAHLTDLLPKLVDKLTPDGKIPQGDIASKGLDILKGMLK